MPGVRRSPQARSVAQVQPRPQKTQRGNGRKKAVVEVPGTCTVCGSGSAYVQGLWLRSCAPARSVVEVSRTCTICGSRSTYVQGLWLRSRAPARLVAQVPRTCTVYGSGSAYVQGLWLRSRAPARLVAQVPRTCTVYGLGSTYVHGLWLRSRVRTGSVAGLCCTLYNPQSSGGRERARSYHPQRRGLERVDGDGVEWWLSRLSRTSRTRPRPRHWRTGAKHAMRSPPGQPTCASRGPQHWRKPPGSERRAWDLRPPPTPLPSTGLIRLYPAVPEEGSTAHLQPPDGQASNPPEAELQTPHGLGFKTPWSRGTNPPAVGVHPHGLA